jgi:hypothetical protein
MSSDIFGGGYTPMKPLSVQEQKEHWARGQQLRGQKLKDGLAADPNFLDSQANRALAGTLNSKELSGILSPDQFKKLSESRATQQRLQAYDAAKRYKNRNW